MGFITSRDYEIVQCLFRGMSNKEIAAELGIKERTAKERVVRLAYKMRIDSKKFTPRIRIVYLFAVYQGLIDRVPMRIQ